MSAGAFSARLLRWYDANRRDMPWRAAPGARPDPYHVWLSEVMLQQTTVATVGPYFEKFVTRWPRLADLAAAELEDVLQAWAGLGYYRRARSLHACAREVVERHDARFPEDEAELLALPGIGPYTAAAIAAIAFGRRAVVVDGNVERVIARRIALSRPLASAKSTIREVADELTPATRCGDHAQAMMDLGATICLPRAPRCLLCPVREGCEAAASGTPEAWPVRGEKRVKPTRFGLIFWLEDPEGRVLFHRRPEQGLLGGMTGLPTSAWGGESLPEPGVSTLAEAGLSGPAGIVPPPRSWQLMQGEVRHTFTHFHLVLAAAKARLDRTGFVPSPEFFWAPLAEAGRLALPSLMRKVVRMAEAAAQSPSSTRS